MAKQSKSRKSKKNSEKTYKKCVKQFSIPIEETVLSMMFKNTSTVATTSIPDTAALAPYFF